MTQPMLEVTGAVKAFGAVTALSGVDLAVPPGRIAARLGPNGGGKTTVVRIVATLVLVILSGPPGLLAVRRWQSG